MERAETDDVKHFYSNTWYVKQYFTFIVIHYEYYEQTIYELPWTILVHTATTFLSLKWKSHAESKGIVIPIHAQKLPTVIKTFVEPT